MDKNNYTYYGTVRYRDANMFNDMSYKGSEQPLFTIEGETNLIFNFSSIDMDSSDELIYVYAEDFINRKWVFHVRYDDYINLNSIIYMNEIPQSIWNNQMKVLVECLIEERPFNKLFYEELREIFI